MSNLKLIASRPVVKSAVRMGSFTGHARECLVIVQGASIVTNFVEPPTSVAAVEKVIDPPDGSPRGR